MGYMKGYSKAGTYSTKKGAKARARWLRGKFFSVKVKKGTCGAAWGNPRTCYRVWVK